MIVFRLLKNPNFILILALVLGIVLGRVAIWTAQLIFPTLALAMTVTGTQIPSRAFLPLRGLVRPMLLAIAWSYAETFPQNRTGPICGSSSAE